MSIFTRTYLLIGLLLICGQAQTSELSNTLTPDKTINGVSLIKFPNDAKVFPEKSNFKIIHTVIMSNDKGERWATITLLNQAHGRRTLNEKHLLALFANGKRLKPKPIEYDFQAKTIKSIIVSFGKRKFPIIQVYSRQ